MKFVLFVGRWQPPHLGHEAVIDTALGEGHGALILVRDVPPDESNPLPAEDVAALWRIRYACDERVVVQVIPDIVAVRYGRKVGYAVEEVEVPPSVHAISATGIREKIAAMDEGWKEHVHPSLHQHVYVLLGEEPT